MGRAEKEPFVADFAVKGVSASELLDSTLDSIMVYRFGDDMVPVLAYANKSAADRRGYGRDEMIGRRLTDFVVPERHEQLFEHIRTLMENGTVSYETVHRRKDGSTFPVEVRMSLLNSAPERMAVAVLRDITQSVELRSELDSALRTALTDRSQLRTMMDVVPVGMALVSPEGGVLEVNEANAEIWATDDHPRPSELGGYIVFRGWDPETGIEYQADDWPVADVMKTGEAVYDRLVEIQRFDGSRGIVEISAIPVKDSQGSIQSMVVLTIDVTDRQRRERLALALDDLNLDIHSTFDRELILQRVLHRTLSAYEADFGMVLQVDDGSCVVHRYLRVPEGLDRQVPYSYCVHGLSAIAARRPIFSEDVASSDSVAAEAKTASVGAMITIPLIMGDGEPLVLEVGFLVPRTFDHAEKDFARKVGDFASFALDNARLYAELAESVDKLAERDRAIRQAYSDVIEAVTGGRLVLLDTEELSEEMVRDLEPRHLIDAPSQLAAARLEARHALAQVDFSEDMILAFGEALNNALKYAGEACYAVNSDESRVQIVVADTGPGIDFGRLPRATLVSGYSTAHTLGVGFTLMMELTDRVLLCTGPTGTTVVLEHELPKVAS